MTVPSAFSRKAHVGWFPQLSNIGAPGPPVFLTTKGDGPGAGEQLLSISRSQAGSLACSRQSYLVGPKRKTACWLLGCRENFSPGGLSQTG